MKPCARQQITEADVVASVTARWPTASQVEAVLAATDQGHMVAALRDLLAG